MATQNDLIGKILEKLQVVPEGQAAEFEDMVRVERNLPSLMAEIASREIVYIPDLQNIPADLFLSLAQVAAYEMRNEFGVTGEFEQSLAAGNEIAIGKLKVMRRGRPTYEPLKTLSF